jgi:hypothetical protein
LPQTAKKDFRYNPLCAQGLNLTRNSKGDDYIVPQRKIYHEACEVEKKFKNLFNFFDFAVKILWVGWG